MTFASGLKTEHHRSEALGGPDSSSSSRHKEVDPSPIPNYISCCVAKRASQLLEKIHFRSDEPFENPALSLSRIEVKTKIETSKKLGKQEKGHTD